MSKVASLLQRFEASHLPEPLRHPWRDARILVTDFLRCNLLQSASAMAYSTLLSVVPSTVAVFTVLQLFAPLGSDEDRTLIDRGKDFILENLASSSAQAVVKYLENMIRSVSLTSLGWGSFASMLFTLLLLLRQIENVMNHIWLVHKARNLFTRFLYFWAFVALGAGALAVVIGLTSGFDFHRLLQSAADEQTVAELGPATTWLVGFGAAFFFFFFVYKVVPNCRVRTRNAAIGALVAAVLLNQGSRFYGIYVKDAKNYQTLYGTLAQLPIFLLWLYICWIIILLGALISWRAQEGFPREESEEEAFDDPDRPLQQLRNVQIKSSIPLLALVAIYKDAEGSSPRGVTAQELAHELKLPLSWVYDSIGALNELGYVVTSNARLGQTGSLYDAYVPAIPAEAVALERLRSDLGRPLEDWLGHWRHSAQSDLREALKVFAEARAPDVRTLRDALARVPQFGR